jgi:MFS family permease
MHRLRTATRVFQGDVRHLPRVVLLTIASFSLFNFSWGFADPFFSVYLSGFSSHYAAVGLFNMLSTLMALLVLVPLGNLLDRVAHGPLIAAAQIAYVGIGGLYFFAGQTGSLAWLLAALLLNGVFGAVVWTGSAATVRQHATARNAGLAFGFFVSARQLAWTLGLGVALLFVWRYPIHYIFLPVILFPLLASLIMPRSGDGHRQPLGQAVRELVCQDKFILPFLRRLTQFNSESWMLFGLLFFFYALPHICFAYVTLYAATHGYSLIEVGMLVLVMNLPFVFSFFAAEISDRSERLRNVIIGCGISALGLAALSIGLDQRLALYGFAALVMVGFSILLPSISGVLTVLTPAAHRGTGSAMFDLVVFGSVVVFSPLIGYGIDAFGWEATFLFAGLFFGAVTLLVAAVQSVFRRRNLLWRVNHPHAKREPYIV